LKIPVCFSVAQGDNLPFPTSNISCPRDSILDRIAEVDVYSTGEIVSTGGNGDGHDQ